MAALFRPVVEMSGVAPSGSPTQGYLRDSRQERVYSLLAQIVGPGPAALYRDASRMRSEEPPYQTTVHLVGHCLREVESAVRGVVAPKHFADDADKTHKRQIESAMRLLGLPEDGDVSKAWQELNLVSWVHRRNLSLRPIDEAFQSTCDHFDAVFDVILRRFASSFQLCLTRVDVLRNTSSPGAEEVKALRQGVPNHRTVFERFFSGALSTQWIAALSEDGFFESPPENAITPMLAYALRIVPESPDTAEMIVSSLNPNSNDGASLYLQVLLALPPDRCAAKLPSVLDWLQSAPSITGMTGLLGSIAANLADAGFTDEASALLAALSSQPTAPSMITGADHGDE